MRLWREIEGEGVVGSWGVHITCDIGRGFGVMDGAILASRVLGDWECDTLFSFSMMSGRVI